MLGLRNKVSVINLSDANLDDEKMNILAASLRKAKLVDDVVELEVSGNKFTFMQTDLPNVLKERFNKLQVLGLGGGAVFSSTEAESKAPRQDFIEFLKSLPELKGLNLGGCNLNEEGAIDIFVEYLKSKSGQKITSLKIPNNIAKFT
jgi:hypothetical protein